MSHLRTFLVASALLLAACSSSGNKVPAGEVMTKERQQAMTPAQAVQRLKDGNDRFTSGRSQHRDLVAEARETAKGQYPLAVVLSCIDSRTPPELIFDQGLGDIFVPRIAGNYAPAGILGSIEFATKIMGAKVIVVLGHSECGAIKGACDDVQLGNITSVIQGLRPAVLATPGFEGHRNSKDPAFVQAVAVQNVRTTLARMRLDSEIIRTMEIEDGVDLVGAMYDLETGKVTFLD